MRWSAKIFMVGVAMMPGILLARGADMTPVARCVLAQPEQSAFSGVLAVSHGTYSGVLPRGLAGASGSRAIDAATRFNIGSAGKMFTAVAVGQLLDAGKIGLGDPIGRHVTGLMPEAAKVTVRQLLTHTSGLGNFFTPDAVPMLERLHSLADLMPLIAADRPRFAPGSRFEYSNTGFALLGMLVERVSGMRYADYLAEHIFRPAGMTGSGLSYQAGNTALGMSNGEVGRGPPPPGPPSPSSGPLHATPESTLPATPAGGLFSTAGDLSRFLRALREGVLLKPATVAMLTQAQVESAPARGDLPALHYGFGFGTGLFDGHRWFGHNGGAPGLNAEAIMFPDDDLVIVVLANRDPPAATMLFRAVRAAAFGKGIPPGC